MLKIGTVLDGKYRILSEIGRGGMSVVYLAINDRANKTWAVKEVSRRGGADTGEAVRGLLLETQLLIRLRHPNLPRIIDVLEEEDSILLVMDYIEGNSLQHLLETGGRQDPELVIGWAKQLCDVLGYLHRRDPPVIYRDMKPANVMLRPDGNVMLIDFGIAREYKDAGSSDTAYLGTRGYAAPEQFGSRGQTDARTDIYNLGATLYHLVTGRSPADTRFVIRAAGDLVPQLKGSGLEALIAKCCQPDPADRYQDCAELRYALEHVHDQDREEVRKRRRRLAAFAGVLAAALVAFVCGLVFYGKYASSVGKQYGAFLEAAEGEPSLAGKLQSYARAVRLDPGRAEAWQGMVRDLQARGEEKLSPEEAAWIHSCVRGKESEQDALLIDALRKKNRPLYAKTSYDLGTILFFSSDNGKNSAYDCLAAAAACRDALPQREAGIAQMMFELAQAQRALNEARQNPYAMGQGYRAYWDLLAGLADGRRTTLGQLMEDSGDPGYPMAVCSGLGNAVYADAANFHSEGVSGEEMARVLALARLYAGSLLADRGLSESIRSRALEVEETLERAQGALDSLFGEEKP